MTKEEFRAIAAASEAEAKTRERYELATVLRGHVAEYYDQGGPVPVDVTQVRKALVIEWLDKHVEDCLADWDAASVALQEALDKYGAGGGGGGGGDEPGGGGDEPGGDSWFDKKTPFTVYVNSSRVNIRTGPGVGQPLQGDTIGFTTVVVVEVKAGLGAKDGWGRLQDGRGWFSLDYAEEAVG